MIVRVLLEQAKRPPRLMYRMGGFARVLLGVLGHST